MKKKLNEFLLNFIGNLNKLYRDSFLSPDFHGRGPKTMLRGATSLSFPPNSAAPWYCSDSCILR